MAKSHSSTIMPDKTVYIPFNGFFSGLMAAIILAVLAVGGFILPILIPQSWAAIVGWGIGGLSLLVLIFLPITVAMDVGDQIPGVKEAREADKELKDISVRHPYLWAIVLLNLAAFWSVIGWVVALAWACSPGKVVVPDKLFAAVNASDGSQEASTRGADTVPVGADTSSLEAELLEINRLVEKDIITKEEAESRRKLILSR